MGRGTVYRNCFYDKGLSIRAVHHGPVNTKNGHASNAPPIQLKAAFDHGFDAVLAAT
jgi:hypothetical protein